MKPVEIKKGIYWVGVVDWNIRTFHGNTYTTRRGSTYNSYLVVDEKIALIDSVFGPFVKEHLDRIREIVPLERIDYIVANHVETDHSGGLPQLAELCPRAKFLGTAKCQEGLEKVYHRKFDFRVVKTGDTVSLGSRTLSFIEAPMIHWPDSMFTYCPEEKVLFPNDAFGQHLATAERFDDEVDQAVLMDEAKKYYANILWPLSGIILKKLQDLQKMALPIDMIAPSHGVIWRKDPAGIVEAYVRWAGNTTVPKAVVVYETMWGSTAMMARAIAQGIADAGVRVQLYDIAVSNSTEIITEMLDAKGFVFGSSTHDNDMLIIIAGFLEYFKGLKPKGRLAGVFGSYGWAGGAVKEIEKLLAETGVALPQESMSVQYVPDQAQLAQCYAWGQKFAQQLRA